MFDGWMWGMHFGWWIFLIVIVVAAWALFRGPQVLRDESPGEILLRRYAAGDISTEEYEDQIGRIMRDQA